MRTWSEVPVPILPPAAGGTSVFDVSSGALREVAPGSRARMYVCGITPYDATHLGHAATYLTFDLLNRVWRDAGRAVEFVQNVTDIDDPLLERAALTGQDWVALAERETELFRDDMAALRVLPPSHFDTAVDAIPDAVERVLALPDFAYYRVDEDVYFHSDAVGQICHLDQEEMASLFAQRGGDPERPGKRNPLDALLWRSERAGEPSWPSQLGAGRPGWHIECVAIAMRYFTLPFDVQGGGRDLVFPHHDMCNALAMALTGQPLAHAFVHAGMIGYNGEKMSKSRGNLVLVSELRRHGVDMNALRLALLADHYRDDREWHEDLLTVAQERLGRWALASHADFASLLPELRAIVRDDLNTPAAIELIDDFCAQPGNTTAVTESVSLRNVVDALLGVKVN